MKLSKFFSYRKVDSTYAIFNYMLMKVIFVSEDYFNNLMNNIYPKEDIEYLRKYGILIDDNKNENYVIDYMRNSLNPSIGKISVVYLIVSEDCNLKCRYCFIEGEAKFKSFEKINFLTAKIFADKYQEYCIQENIDEPNIIFYGGEPLTNFNCLKNFVDYCNQSNYHFKFSIVTNSLLLNIEIIEFLKNNSISIGISIDGPKYINDINRIQKDNTGSYDLIMDKISLLKSYNLDFALSFTISKDVLANKNDVLNWIGKIGVKNVNFNLLLFTEYDDTWKEYYDKATDFIIEIYEKYHNCGLYDDRINRKIKSLQNLNFKFSDCAALTNNQLTIKPNGSVTSCQGDLKTNKNIFGNIINDSFSSIITELNESFKANELTLYNDKCLKCDVIYTCGSGCLITKKALFTSDKDYVNKAFCIHTKKIFDWMIHKLFMNQNI